MSVSTYTECLDCSQSPIFPWDFRDSNASFELPPSCKSERNLGRVSKPDRGGPSQVTLRSVKNSGTVTTSY